MRLLLVRHAESQGNAEGRLQGRREFPLTERGLEQAQALASRLAGMHVAAVYASPIQRALQTALAIGRECGVDVRTDDRLQEYDFGATLSGLTWREIRDRQPELVAALVSNRSEFPRYPGEEGREAFRERVCAVITEIVERHKADNAVALVTHGGPIVVHLMATLGREYARPIPFSIENGSITTVELAASPSAFTPAAVVTGINDTCHLAHIEPRAKLRVD